MGLDVIECESLSDVHSVLRETEASKVVMINFYAGFCRSCLENEPKFRRLALEHPSLTYLKVDVTDVREAISFFDLKHVPTYIAMRGQEEIARYVGVKSEGMAKLFAKASSE